LFRQFAADKTLAGIEKGEQRNLRVGSPILALYRFPKFLDGGGEVLGAAFEVFEEGGEAAGGEEFDILGEHGEEAAHEEGCDFFGGVAGGFEGFGEFGEAFGDFAGDFGAAAGRVEGERVDPDGFEAVADGFVIELVEEDAVVLDVGEVGIGFAGAGEVGEEFERVTDVDDDEEGRSRELRIGNAE